MGLVPIQNESALIKQVVNSNEIAFKSLFMAYHNQIAQYVFFLTDSKEITEEIVQDVFMKIWQNRHELDQILNFSAYLFILTRNHTLNTIKKAENARKASFTYTSELYKNNVQVEDNTGVDIEFFHSLLEETIEILPNQQKQVFKYRMVGFKNPEIAMKMGISIESVRKYHHLAIHALIKHLNVYQTLAKTVTILLFGQGFIN